MTNDLANQKPSSNSPPAPDVLGQTGKAHRITAAAVGRFALMHPYTAVTATALTIMGIGATLKHSSEWDTVYVGAADALRQHKDIYRDLIGYTYPPFSAWAMMPFTLFPIHLARCIWFIVSAICLVYLIKSAWRLSGGARVEPLSDPVAGQRREQIAFLIGHAIALQLTLNGLTHLQPDILIAAMLMAGVSAIVGGRYFRAAVWIGVAAAFKATPLLFAPYLMWRKQWAAGVLVIVVAVAANFLPDTVHRPDNGGAWLTHWYHQYLRPMTSSKYVPGDWQNKLDNNQALAGAANRWLATTWANEVPPPDPRHPTPRPANAKPEFVVIERANPAGPTAIRAFFAASCLAVLLPSAWVMWKRRRRLENVPSSGPTEGGFPSQTILECGIVMLLMVLLSPNSSRAHFCILYLAGFSVARLAVRPGASIIMRVFLSLSIVASTLSIHVRLPGSETGEQIMLWIGVVMLATIFLLGASITAMFVACGFASNEPMPANSGT